MKAELKQNWMQGLLSGRYEQGTKVLRSPANKFCCLGVLLDIASPNGWGSISDYLCTKDGYMHEGALKTVDLLSAGFLHSCGLSETQMMALAEMNDGGEDFNSIAGWIETNIRTDESPPAIVPRDSL